MRMVKHSILLLRRSERTADEIRDPKDRKSPSRFRILWLEERVNLIYETMLRMGKSMFGSEFTMSWPYFLNLRPFYVKAATRETCMCVYHLRWREFSDGLLRYRNTLRQQKVATCSCSWPTNEKLLRKQLVCERQPDSAFSLDNVKCILQQCLECAGAKKLTNGPGGLCTDEMRDPGHGLALKVHYESYEKITYVTKDGTEKVKKDFVSKEVPFSEFKKALEEYWPKFLAHHNDAKWHDNDFVSLKLKLPRHRICMVIDYAENYSHKPRFEHQSKYFSQVQTTIIPVVVMIHAEDLMNITEAEREDLISTFDDFGLPHIVSETHFIISSDMQHDNLMVQKLLDDLILEYIKANAPSVKEVHVRSDGCKAQFKCAANFHWISRQQVEGCGMKIHWSFFESCHGKCYCDPEGGTLKNAAARHELNITNAADQLKDSYQMYLWARDKSNLQVPKLSLRQKRGRGIYRRFFHWIPSKGVGAVDRSRVAKWKAEGTSKLHEFVDIGVVGTVSTRRASCHQCTQCWDNDRSNCSNKEYVGMPVELSIVREAVPAMAAARIDRATLNRESISRAEGAMIGSIVCVETHDEEQNYPWLIGVVKQTLKNAPTASAPYDPAKDVVHLEPVRVNEPALELQLYEGLAPGSPIFCESEVVIWVPGRRVRVVDVELEETRCSSRLAAAQDARRQFTVSENSLSQIRAMMPTVNDRWVVERVIQYRCKYGIEQWLVKWEGYGEDHNTWEPWDNLLSPMVEKEAVSVRMCSLPRDREGLMVVVVVTLRAALSALALDASGSKAALVDRLLPVILQA